MWSDLITTWYLNHKAIKVFDPASMLESVIVPIFVELELGFYAGELPERLFWEMYSIIFPEGIDLGRSLYLENDLKKMRKSGFPGREVFDRIVQLVN
jgi:hypothetical protein